MHNGIGNHPKMIEEYAGYLRQRWEQGCTNAEQLYQEITAMGYRGTGRSVREYVRPWRSQTTVALPPPPQPTVRQATGWFLRHPDTLDADEHQHLQALTAACPALAALREHVRAFAQMMVHLASAGLEQWMKRVQADDLPELHSFVTGLRRDFDAAKAGLTFHVPRRFEISTIPRLRSACAECRSGTSSGPLRSSPTEIRLRASWRGLTGSQRCMMSAHTWPWNEGNPSCRRKRGESYRVI
ncbi:hypothetical protein AB0C14_39525 [Microbispora hainanensis]|uniref:DesA/ISL3 alpha bundle tail domain-containing protein n=1 Tax=Microbispora hainanensis TaxID=568844 RepID=UPI0033E78509